MPPPYGVVPTGFNRKPLAEILTDHEETARIVFGPDIIVEPESPMGQLLGLFALLTSQVWELSQDTYDSYDPDQAERVRLDTLAKLRIVARALDESDPSLRQAITNAGRARIDLQDLRRAVFNIPGVTFAHIFVNDDGAPDADGIPGHSVAVAVLGGADEEIAKAVRAHVVPGIGAYGNVPIDTEIDGICRSIAIIRPALVPVTLSVTVSTFNDKMGCPPPAPSSIAVGLAEELAGPRRLINGGDVTAFVIRQAIECRWSNVEFVSAQVARGEEPLDDLPLAIDLFEIAKFDANNIQVTVA